MKKRDFLIPVATLAAAVAADQAAASVVSAPAVEESMENHLSTQASAKPKEEMVTGRHGDNLFGFLLKRGEDGKMLAYHYSHSSHASHSSHSSHYSSSGY